MDPKALTYEVFHRDGDPSRNLCATQIHRVMGRTFERLNSPTVYLETFAQAEEFLTQHSGLTFKRIPPKVEGGPSWPTGSGVMGVWASTYLAYTAFLATDKQYLVLFEDDALVSENIADVLNAYLPELPEGWDFFTLFVPDDCIQWYSYPRVNQPWVKPDVLGPKDYEIGQPHVCRNYQDWSCAGYVISRKGAQNTLDDIAEHSVGNPIDWYVFNVRQMDSSNQYFETYSIKPAAYRPVRLYSQASKSSVIHRQTEQA